MTQVNVEQVWKLLGLNKIFFCSSSFSSNFTSSNSLVSWNPNIVFTALYSKAKTCFSYQASSIYPFNLQTLLSMSSFGLYLFCKQHQIYTICFSMIKLNFSSFYLFCSVLWVSRLNFQDYFFFSFNTSSNLVSTCF